MSLLLKSLIGFALAVCVVLAFFVGRFSSLDTQSVLSENPVETATATTKATSVPSLSSKDFVIVFVTDKVSTNDECNICYRVEVTLKAENKSDIDIKAVKGVLTIYDVFDTPIISSDAKLENKILPAYSSQNWRLGMDVSKWNDKQWEVYNTHVDYLKFSFKVTDIVFVDGSSQSF
jgi:hypothetical protein